MPEATGRQARAEGSAPLFRVAEGPALPPGEAAWFVARSGRRLRTARFDPPGAPRGTVVLSTGRTEPIEKYGEVIGELGERGFVVLAHDWAGQGLSERFVPDRLVCDVIGGVPALTRDFTDILDAHAHLPKPWLTVAHSLGAALTAVVLSEGESRFALAALCAPMIEFRVGRLPFAAIRAVVAGVGRIDETRLARAQVDPGELPFEQNQCTRDRTRYERARALYRAAPDVRLGEPTWRWLEFAVDVRQRLVRPGAAEAIRCPLLAVGAGDDRIVSTEAIRRFVARVPNGRYCEAPGAYHEVLMGTDAERACFWQAFDELVRERL